MNVSFSKKTGELVVLTNVKKLSEHEIVDAEFKLNALKKDHESIHYRHHKLSFDDNMPIIHVYLDMKD